ncbi:DUF418 domain-containing protein [Saccharopolyspora erythraea]|nr:DUF418 domain-containing protein [Saccharopolyspora erythraea]
MFAAHAGPQEPGNWLFGLVSGRSAALFAVLAGVSIALLSGGDRPQSRSWAAASARIAVRAAVLFPLGLALTSMQVPARVILAVYAVLFLLSIPLLRLRAGVLGALAAGTAITGPLASFWIRKSVVQTEEMGITPSLADMTSLDGLGRALQAIVLDGAYPVLTWIPFVLAGMAVGRLDLRAVAVRLRLAGVGVALALLGYGGSWLGLNVLGGRERILSLFAGQPPQIIDLILTTTAQGASYTTDPAMLLMAAPHSGTPFEVVGAGGFAIAVIGLCLLISDRLGMLVRPLASVGALALTAYVGHLVALWAYGTKNLTATLTEQPYLPWLVLVISALIATTAWRSVLGRGPLEWVLHRASAGAAALAHRR